MKGTVKWFDFKKGYGFIQPEDGGDDVFVHHTSLPKDENGRTITLNDGYEVEFEIEQGDKGPNAVKVKVLSEGEATAKSVIDEPDEDEIV